MFGKKKETVEPTAEELVGNQVALDILKLSAGESITYRIPERYWAGFAAFLTVEKNPNFPDKGRKYIMYTDKAVDGKPAGKRNCIGGANKLLDVAEWISQKSGVPYP